MTHSLEGSEAEECWMEREGLTDGASFVDWLSQDVDDATKSLTTHWHLYSAIGS